MSHYSDEEKHKLLDEIKLKNRILVEGIAFTPEIFRHLDIGGKYIEQVNVLFTHDRHAHSNIEFPACFLTPLGKYRVQIR